MGCGHDWVGVAPGLHRHPETCTVAAAREALGQADAQPDGFIAATGTREAAFRGSVLALQNAVQARRKARRADGLDD